MSMMPEDLDAIEARANAAKDEFERDDGCGCPLCEWIEQGTEDVLALVAEVRMLRVMLRTK